MSTGLRIGHVAQVVGIRTTTLRAWEQRYGIVTPIRSETSGYRCYTSSDVDRLRHMRALVESGVAVNRAAAIVARSEPFGDGPADVSGHDALVRAGRFFNGADLARLLDDAFAAGPVEDVIEHWLLPSMHAVGAAWESGRMTVAAEHFVAAAVMRRLGALFDATPAGSPRVVVGLPPHGHHEIPALAFAVCLRRRGMDVLYAGADVPLESWGRLAAEWAPRMVVTVATMADDVPNADAVGAVLREAGVPAVYVGGANATAVPSAIPLPLSMTASADVLVEAASAKRWK
ncbi:MerR family transcriptional regulator [Gordonia spumicola]|uniref:MerR family transcriptional regulator n=1 Tax=Gordonia spumicola TaxID=589161 RepID=A0A7I9V4J7_9ACTN|nr:MerR family transcriptional regulator [Gordonia spumicola]GEE00113.1 MerR family transcriptional regulator [Gordonia spumicola]